MNATRNPRLVAALALLLALPALAQQSTHRFGLFVGSTEGGDGTRPLLYAQDDARRLHELFVRLGEVERDDAMLVLGGAAVAVSIALGELERRIRDAKARGEATTLVVHVSAHAKDGALRLGKTKLAFEALKAQLASGPADVKLAFFDVCRSDAPAGRRAPAFEVETRQLPGVVLVTATAPDEAAKESDVVGAGFFSYHLKAALLGAADASGDGRVTLAEAFIWAWERTIAATDGTAGAQEVPFSAGLAALAEHPLTEVRVGLRIPATAPPGTYFVIDAEGVVVAEVMKLERERILGLAPGRYTLKRRLPDRLRLGTVELASGEITTLDEGALKNAAFSSDPVKGTGLSATFSRHWSIAVSGQYQLLFDRPSFQGGYFPSAPLLGAEIVLHNFPLRGLGLAIDGGYGWSSGVLASPSVGELSFTYSLLTLGGALFYEWFQDGRWIPFAGVHVGFSAMSREFTDKLIGQTYSTFKPGAFAGLKVRITKNISIVARARVHYLHYDIDETRSLGSADFGALLDYEFKD